MKRSLFSALLCVAYLVSACTLSTGEKSDTTPILPKSPTSTASATATQAPVMLTLINQAVVLTNPETPACQDYAYLDPGSQVQVFGTFGDFASVVYDYSGNKKNGWIPRSALSPIPPSIPELNKNQVDWKSMVNYSGWSYYSAENGGSLFVDPQKEEFSDMVSDSSHHPVTPPLRIRFGMTKTNPQWATVKLDGIDPIPDRKEWWEGNHRMDIYTNNGFYEICVRDGKQADCNISLVTSIPEKELFSIVFTDTNGKSFEVWNQDNQLIQVVDLAGNPNLQMAEGLFPSGWFQFGTSVGPSGTMTLDHLSIETPPSGEYVEGWNTQPGLSELAKPLGILIGAELNPDSLMEIPFCTAAKHDFNLAYLSVFTDAKVWISPEEYNFTTLDQQVDDAYENGYTLYASHLVWGATEPGVLPDWLTKGGYTKDELLSILEHHVKTIVSRYKDKVTFWSIANEATVRDQSYGADFWFDHIGSEYIEKAFQWAREAGPEEVLVFNADRNESPRDAFTSWHINLMIQQVKNLKAKGVPIDVVGMQMHLYLPWNSKTAPDKADVVATMKSFGELGVKIMITEMDVDLHEMRGTNEEKISRQTQIYGDMMSACIEAGNCIAFSTWGVSDAYSWVTCLGEGWYCAVYPGPMPDAAPLLFDTNFQPKLAYFAVRDALLTAQK
jgi:endo-1,4-beta-xylanase